MKSSLGRSVKDTRGGKPIGGEQFCGSTFDRVSLQPFYSRQNCHYFLFDTINLRGTKQSCSFNNLSNQPKHIAIIFPALAFRLGVSSYQPQIAHSWLMRKKSKASFLSKTGIRNFLAGRLFVLRDCNRHIAQH